MTSREDEKGDRDFSLMAESKQDRSLHSNRTDKRSSTTTSDQSPLSLSAEDKVHWSTTEKGALVARATAHVYRIIIAPHGQGGMKDLIENNCHLFLDISGVSFIVVLH